MLTPWAGHFSNTRIDPTRSPHSHFHFDSSSSTMALHHHHMDDLLGTDLLRASFYKTPQEEDEVCLYPSKKCTNLRAKKKNGDLHTMCEYHRIRANENQRRLERRRKAALRFPHRQTAKQSIWNRDFPEPTPIQSIQSTPAMHFDTVRPYALSPSKRQDLISHWQPIEIEILMTCLFGGEEDDEGVHKKEEEGRLHSSHVASLRSPLSHTVNFTRLI